MTLFRAVAAALALAAAATAARAGGGAVDYRMVGWSQFFGDANGIAYLEGDVRPDAGGILRVEWIDPAHLRISDGFGADVRDYVGDGGSYAALLDGLALLVEPATPLGPVADWLQQPRADLRPLIRLNPPDDTAVEALLLTGDRLVLVYGLFNMRGFGYGQTVIAARVDGATFADIAAGRLTMP
ncbi:MAG: hypothetical protein R3F55_14900 [Alphaproteobacteria bacterium]